MKTATTISDPDEIIDFPKNNPRLKIVNHKGLLYVVERFYHWSPEKKRGVEDRTCVGKIHEDRLYTMEKFKRSSSATARPEPFANRSGETLLRNECREGGCDKTLRSSLRD